MIKLLSKGDFCFLPVAKGKSIKREGEASQEKVGSEKKTHPLDAHLQKSRMMIYKVKVKSEKKTQPLDAHLQKLKTSIRKARVQSER